jgi:hypothetical protein
MYYNIPAAIAATATTAVTAVVVRRGVLGISNNYWLNNVFPTASPEFVIL